MRPGADLLSEGPTLSHSGPLKKETDMASVRLINSKKKMDKEERKADTNCASILQIYAHFYPLML